VGSVNHSRRQADRTADAHKMNLIGLTSSRKVSRTNAYTERILLLEGNTFSSCVRSGKRTLIVVYIQTRIPIITRV
jgi:hypothetical protein